MAPIVCLTRPLAEAHRQKQAGSPKAIQKIVADHGDQQADERLDQIGGNNGYTGIKSASTRALILLFFQIAQGHRDKSQAQAMIGQHFQG